MYKLNKLSLGKGELYELLCLMMMGSCLWIAGEQLGIFDHILVLAVDHGLLHILILIACMTLGVYAATIRKSVLLRSTLSALLAAEKAAATAARHDPLTGLPNRRHFLETFERRLNTCGAEEEFAVMMIDLDRFKPVNDVHGHAAGDAVLCVVADRLNHILPPKSSVARLGGDEFVALVPYAGNQDTLVVLAQEIIESFRAPIPWSEGQVEVSATIGIAVVGSEDHDAEAALHAADLAMYEGKREGRGNFRFFQEEMDINLRARLQAEADLRKGIQHGEIAPHFQPIVKLPSEEVVGFEVLARWYHPTKGLILPDNFVPLAEETGMIGDLFYSILDQAAASAANWPPHLQLSVNIAPQQFRDHYLAERILGILTKNGFPPGRLEIEVTESSLITDLEAARSQIASLQSLGIKIALDDFGTGYSSLYHLKELKFDKIKIDKSYLTTLSQDSDEAKFVDAIIKLGSSLSIETTAEGIESSSNLDWLSKQGCTFAQGYLFGRPMTKEAVDDLLEAKQAPAIGEDPAHFGIAA